MAHYLRILYHWHCKFIVWICRLLLQDELPSDWLINMVITNLAVYFRCTVSSGSATQISSVAIRIHQTTKSFDSELQIISTDLI